MTEMTDNVGFH